MGSLDEFMDFGNVLLLDFERESDYATEDTHYNDGNIDTVWELMEAVFTMVYVLEAILKIMVLGWKRYSQSGRNIFDFSITLMAVLASAYVYYPNAYSNSQLI